VSCSALPRPPSSTLFPYTTLFRSLGSGEVTDADIDDRPDLTDPGWWRDAAQSAVKSLVGPRAGLDLSGLRGRGDEDTAALGEGGRRGRAEEGAHRFHRTVEARSRHRMGLRPDRTSGRAQGERSEEHTSELQSRFELVCRLLI